MKQLILPALVAVFGLSLAAHAVEEPKIKAPQTEKKDVKKDEKPATAEIGKPAPDFTLTDVNGKSVKLSDYKGKIVVLEWFNQDCPYCQYVYGDTGPLKDLPERMTKQGIVWLSINTGNSANAEAAKKFMEAHKMTTPMLLDADGKVGTAYAAKTTPHCYVIDEKGVLRYRGALDNAPMGKVADKEAKTNYVETAINELKNGKAVTTTETKSYGCSVKYPKS
ncbi:MAG: redoxin domain-containing protein [Planctomycetota bacterium]|mgnify:CR=1 FL=1